jgi:hypothetical protein
MEQGGKKEQNYDQRIHSAESRPISVGSGKSGQGITPANDNAINPRAGGI